eukprot:g7393.t1
MHRFERCFLCVIFCLVLVNAQTSSRTSRTKSSSETRTSTSASSTSTETTTTTTTTRSSRSSSGSGFDDSFLDDFFTDTTPGSSSFSSGSTRSTVYARTSASATSGDSKKSRGSKSKEKSEKSETRSVKLGDGSVTSRSVASGSGSVSASASARVGPGGEEGTASTTIDGKTRTTTKRRDSKKSKSEKSTKSEKSEKFEKSEKSSLSVCRGLAKFKCCDDRSFVKLGDDVFCGCFGSGTKDDVCFYRRLNNDPVVIEDIFGVNKGETCQCSETEHEPCIGVMREDCCEGYNGKAPKCYCPDEDEHCHYQIISRNPLIWRDNRFGKTTCIC